MKTTSKILAALLVLAALFSIGCKQKVVNSNTAPTTSSPTPSAATTSTGDKSTVYLTREISPEALVKIYNALGRKAEGRVAVKISTGEAGNNNYLNPTSSKTSSKPWAAPSWSATPHTAASEPHSRSIGRPSKTTVLRRCSRSI